MLLLGIDIGTSSVKVSVVDATTQLCIAAASYPEGEAEIIAHQSGWAEQSPDSWWHYVQQAILNCHAQGKYKAEDIGSIGIAYQMHGLVLIDKEMEVLRNAIIWCDSRAVEVGNKAFEAIGHNQCLTHLLNAPGNFTARKLAWVKQNEPAIYEQIHQVLLPGDFIAMKLTGNTTTTFEFITKLGVPYYCFHYLDAVDYTHDINENERRLAAISEYFKQKQEASGVKLLWGTANLFSNRRYMNGAATNPDFQVVAHAGAQVKAALDATIALGGENYVFWGGREGYMSLLNTNMKKEKEHLAKFLHMAKDYARKHGFTGTFFIEPKPCEPSKHQYDYDCETVIGFLRQYDLLNDFKLNIEVNHATLAGHTFQHELQVAADAGLLDSMDANRGDYQNGWDTDQFPNNINELVEAMLVILEAGGFAGGGINFDAKIRRNSTDPADLFYAHIGGMDAFARSLIVAEQVLEKSDYRSFRQARYASFNSGAGMDFASGKLSLDDLRSYAIEHGEPAVISGRQEYLENLINRVV